eukprot:143052-Amphidinium_carterae.1
MTEHLVLPAQWHRGLSCQVLHARDWRDQPAGLEHFPTPKLLGKRLPSIASTKLTAPKRCICHSLRSVPTSARLRAHASEPPTSAELQLQRPPS